MTDLDQLERLQLLLQGAQRASNAWSYTMEELDAENEHAEDMIAFTNMMRACIQIQVHITRRIAEFYLRTTGEIPALVADAIIDLQAIEREL